MAMKKKCFVISPIGDESSEVRAEADAILWVAKSALEKYDFEVIRVDQIARSTMITNEIIQLIQESELCLIVLTGHNPNVFYEAGRRHETGRPFIQLIRKDESLPFDVASIRTILYDNIQSLPSAVKVVEQIERFIDEFEKGGYGASGTGVSLSTLAVALDRIERKIGQLMGGSAPVQTAGGFPVVDSVLGFVRNPREAFLVAVAQGDLPRAASLLPRLEQIMGPTPALVALAGLLALQGYEPAAELVYRLITEHFDKIYAEDIDSLQVGVSSIVQFYVVTDREREGVARCEPLIQKVVNLPEVDSKIKAKILNQLQMLHYGARQYQNALSVCEQVLELDSEEAAYIYNASLIYRELGLTQKAIDMVDRYMKMSELEGSHLSHAVETYIAIHRVDDAKAAFLRLRQVSRDKASLLLFQNEDIANELGIRGR